MLNRRKNEQPNIEMTDVSVIRVLVCVREASCKRISYEFDISTDLRVMTDVYAILINKCAICIEF